MSEPAPGSFPTSTGLAVLFVAAALVTLTTVERYVDPVGEKYFHLMRPGAADFRMTFAGARALLRGENPYRTTLLEAADPWNRVVTIEGVPHNVAYPPSQLLFYVPLARLVEDPRAAGRIVFWTNLGLLLVLAGLAWWLLVGAAEPAAPSRRSSLLLVPLLYFIFTANVGTSLGLERGQSDVIGAVLCWGGVALFLKGGRFWPALLVTAAILMKGYAVLLGLGLGLLAAPRRGLWPMVAGVLAAAAVLLLPVIVYVDDGFRAAAFQARHFMDPYWFNHGFLNLFHTLSPPLAQPGRLMMTAAGLLTSVLCWRRARRALERVDRRDSVLWVSLFALAALVTTVGFGAASFVYNQVLLLPGAFVLLLVAPGGPILPAATAFLLFKYRLGSETFPLASLGLALLMLGCGRAALRK